MSTRVFDSWPYIKMDMAAQEAVAAVNEALMPFGISDRQFRALLVLEHGRCNQAGLGDALRINRNGTTALVDDLERLGVAERRVNPVNRREHHLLLTAHGRNVLRQAKAAVLEATSLPADLTPSLGT